jgi:dihydroorotate dehydrogenase (NAD+) catalytic subunit
VPLCVSVMGFDHDELRRLVTEVGRRDEVALIELNFSCPNVETGLIMGADPAETASAVDVLRPLTRKPLIVKLTPNATDPAEVAAAAADAGADAVSLINTLRGMALHPRTREPWLGGRTGGVSGPAVRAIALAQVASVADRVKLPIVAMGGVESGKDVADLLDGGATLVAVGTETFRDPHAGGRIKTELESLDRGQAEASGEAAPSGETAAKHEV